MATKLDQSSPADSRQSKPTGSPSLAPKLSIFGTKAGFVIPKNKLAGSLVIRGSSAKNETPTASKEENNKHVQRKTKWGPDLASEPAVCKGRALAYQTRVEQITKQLKSGALEIGKMEGSTPTVKGSNSDGTDNLKESEGKVELLELERREIIGEILRLNPGYKAPDDYKPLLKETKIPLPAKAHPGHNVIGVLIGPESNTQKRLQEETGAIIRVYGTKKMNEEKNEIRHTDIDEAQAAYEDLYISVSADSYDKVDAAVALIELLLAPVSVNSIVTSTIATVSSAVTSDAVNPADVQLMQRNTSQSGLLHYQTPWLSTPQTNDPSILYSGPVSSSLSNNPLQLQPPVVSFNILPYTGQPPHMNTMPRNPLPVPGPPTSMPNIQQPPPQFRANPPIGPPFGQPPGIVSLQLTPSSSVPPPVRPLQTPHASGGWPSFSPVMSQSQRPPQASPTFMPMRPPISVSPLGATPSQGPVALVPPSNIPTNYRSQHSPVANFTPATLISRPPGGAQSFPSVLPQGPSSMQILPFPAGASAQSPYPLSMQARPTMSIPDTVRGPPPAFSQVVPTPGMVPSSVGSSCPPASAPASTSCSQSSIGALRPPRPAAGDFTFRPVVSPSPTPDFPASASQMGIHANTRPCLPHAPFFHPANHPNVPVQGFQRRVDGRPMGQPRMYAPPPHFPEVFPVGFRAIPPAVQPGGRIISPPMPPPSNVSSFLPSRPFQFMPLPHQNPFPNTSRQGESPGGANPIYDPFAPTAASGAKKTEADPEYEDLMASVGMK
ncbi:extensin-like isoform X2 [Phragmites australis]|uniref:extensin-like isoform X2 n=1 Tax=Phragmites australis TaxID=29695 RepID=UPI002D789FD2|nr:extensin-like isoform X2 [Phragmites australis]